MSTDSALIAASVPKSAPHPYVDAIHAVSAPCSTAPTEPAPFTNPLAVPSTSAPYPAASHVSAMDDDPRSASGPATSMPMSAMTSPLTNKFIWLADW